MDCIPTHPSQDKASVRETTLEGTGESAEDPYSPGPQALPYVVGALIALATATVPLLTVVMGRTPPPNPEALSRSGTPTAPPTAAPPPAAIPSALAQESDRPYPKPQRNQR